MDYERWSQLMADAQNGDRSAYELLLSEIVPFVRAIVARQHRTSDAIDDVVQDVLLTLHRARHTYEPGRPFQAWLGAIARHRSIDALRHRVRRNAQETSDVAAYETFADPAANRDIEASDAAAVLGSALAALTARQRQAIELVKIKEMSLAEASKASGQSVAALKVNIHRGIRTLRMRLVGA